jgi:flagellar motor component MotA
VGGVVEDVGNGCRHGVRLSRQMRSPAGTTLELNNKRETKLSKISLMVLFTILAGGFSNFIASYVFNNVTSTLTLKGNFSSGDNPAWITANANRSVL